MRIARALVVAIAALMMAGRYYQEWRRLGTITKLDGKSGRAYYEKIRQQNDRVLTWFTATLVVSAIAALGYTALIQD
jgi:hypothetical protein